MALLTYEFNAFIQTENLIAQNLSERYTQEMIVNYLDLRKKWTWVVYVFSPIILYVSTLLIALVIIFVIDLYYLNINKQNIKFGEEWKVVLMSQWTAIAAMFSKIIWFGFYQDNYTLEEVQTFYPLSIINLIDKETLDSWLRYPIQLINLYELLYWIILIAGIKKLLQCSWLRSIIITFLSYGVILLIWIIIIMFITLNMSQI